MSSARRRLPVPLATQGAVFLFGGIGGALLDQLHVQLGVLSYRAPTVLGQAWWVAPQFGLASVVLLLAAVPFARRTEDRIPIPTTSTFAFAGAWLFAAYVLSALLDTRARLLLVLLVSTWLGRVAFARAKPEIALFSVLLGAAGTTYECVLSSTGVYWFHRPGILTVPLWLPALYAHGAPLAVHLARRLTAPPSSGAGTA